MNEMTMTNSVLKLVGHWKFKCQHVWGTCEVNLVDQLLIIELYWATDDRYEISTVFFVQPKWNSFWHGHIKLPNGQFENVTLSEEANNIKIEKGSDLLCEVQFMNFNKTMKEAKAVSNCIELNLNHLNNLPVTHLQIRALRADLHWSGSHKG